MQTINIEFWSEVPENYTGAIHFKNGNKITFLNGEYHSFDDKPAVEFHYGSKQWIYKGKLHRLDGHALEYPDGTKYYYVNNKLHRLDGPATIYPNGEIEYWYDGTKTTKKALELLQNIMKLRELHEKQ